MKKFVKLCLHSSYTVLKLLAFWRDFFHEKIRETLIIFRLNNSDFLVIWRDFSHRKNSWNFVNIQATGKFLTIIIARFARSVVKWDFSAIFKYRVLLLFFLLDSFSPSFNCILFSTFADVSVSVSFIPRKCIWQHKEKKSSKKSHITIEYNID